MLQRFITQDYIGYVLMYLADSKPSSSWSTVLLWRERKDLNDANKIYLAETILCAV